MPANQSPLNKLIIQPALVAATYVESRLIDVELLGYKVKLHKIPVVTSPQEYSMPNVGDTGLVIGTEHNAYYLGKIDFNYADKIKGVEDPETGITLLGKKVNDGELYFSNLLTRTWLAMTGGGDFSLANGMQHGLMYSANTYAMTLGANVIKMVANGVQAAIGSVMRNLPKPDTIIPSTVPTIPAVEIFFDIMENTLRMARLHLGYVKDSLGIDEMSSYALRIRAMLEACNAAGLTVTSLSMDEAGNTELVTALGGNIDITAETTGYITLTTNLNGIDMVSTAGDITATTTTGAVVLDGKPASGVLLAGATSANSVVLGEPLLTWLGTHTHGTAVGPSSPPVQPLVSATLLSAKVKVS